MYESFLAKSNTSEFSWFCLGTFSYMGEMNYFCNPEKKKAAGSPPKFTFRLVLVMKNLN